MHFYSWSDYSTTTRLLNYHHYYSTTTTTTIIAYWLLKFLTIISLYYKSNPTSSFNTGTVGTVTFFVFKKLCLNQSTAQFKNALNAYSHYLLVTSLLFLPLPNKYCSPVGRRFAPRMLLLTLSCSVELVWHLWKMSEKFDIYSKIFYRDVEKFVQYLCVLVLRHQMRVSNYLVKSFYSVGGRAPLNERGAPPWGESTLKWKGRALMGERAPLNESGAPSWGREHLLIKRGLLGGRFGDFLLFFMQLRVDDH